MSIFIWSVNVRTNTDLKYSRLCLYMTNLDPEKTNDLPKTRKMFGNISVTQVFFVFFFALHLRPYYPSMEKKKIQGIMTKEVHTVQYSILQESSP